MSIWRKFRYKSSSNQLSFHLVCCEEFDQLLERVEREHFADFEVKERAQVVNALLTVMEPFLLKHINLDYHRWEFSLSQGEKPLSEVIDGERGKMDQELWILLDPRIYRLLKKVHEAGDRGFRERRKRGGTFSMALVLRGLLIRVFDLLDKLGRDGLLFWLNEWLANYEKVDAPNFRARWEPLEYHMVALKRKNVKYIGLYNGNYFQLHLYHPPPDKKNT